MLVSVCNVFLELAYLFIGKLDIVLIKSDLNISSITNCKAISVLRLASIIEFSGRISFEYYVCKLLSQSKTGYLINAIITLNIAVSTVEYLIRHIRHHIAKRSVKTSKMRCVIIDARHFKHDAINKFLSILVGFINACLIKDGLYIVYIGFDSFGCTASIQILNSVSRNNVFSDVVCIQYICTHRFVLVNIFLNLFFIVVSSIDIRLYLSGSTFTASTRIIDLFCVFIRIVFIDIWMSLQHGIVKN